MLYKQKYPTDIVAQGFKEYIANTDKNFAVLQAIDDEAKKADTLLHRYIRFNVADGYAFYQIVKVGQRTCTVVFCKGVAADDYMDSRVGERGSVPMNYALQNVGFRDFFNKAK